MSQMSGLENRVRSAANPAGMQDHPGLRVILLSLATGVLLTGALVAAIACYLTLGGG